MLIFLLICHVDGVQRSSDAAHLATHSDLQIWQISGLTRMLNRSKPSILLNATQECDNVVEYNG
jgi:hypothetical protein